MEQEEFKKGEIVWAKMRTNDMWFKQIYIIEWGGRFICTYPHRDKVIEVWDEIKKIEPVYRLLNKDEITKEGDQIMMSHDIWAMAKEGVKVGYSTIRRKIKTYEE